MTYISRPFVQELKDRQVATLKAITEYVELRRGDHADTASVHDLVADYNERVHLVHHIERDERDVQALDVATFGKYLSKLLPRKRLRTTGTGNKQVMHYVGIRLP